MGPRPAWRPMLPADRSPRLLWAGLPDWPPPLDLPPPPSPFSSSPRAASRAARYSQPQRMPPPPSANYRLVASYSLLLVNISLDQARIDREARPDKPGRDAPRHHALEHPPQGIAVAKAFVPGAAKHRMIGNLIFDTQLAKPAIGQVHLHLRAEPPLRTDRKHVAQNSIRIISTGSIEGRPVCEKRRKLPCAPNSDREPRRSGGPNDRVEPPRPRSNA